MNTIFRKRRIRVMGMSCLAGLLIFQAAAEAAPPQSVDSELIAFASLQLPGTNHPDTLKALPINKWFEIPDWLAGTWKSSFQTVTQAYDYRLNTSAIDGPVNISVERITEIGTQKDKFGRIWHFAGTPYIRKLETDSSILIQKIQRLELLRSDNSRVTIMSVAEVTRIRKPSNELVDTFIEQTVTDYVPLNTDSIQADFAIADYDLSGKQISSSRDLSIAKRVAPFYPIDSDNRENLRQMFRAYLQFAGMSELLPDR